MEQNISDRWLAIRDAAAYLRVSVSFIRKLVRHRRIPFARLGTKALRFRRSDLDRWVEAHSCGGEVDYRQEERRNV